MLATTVFNSWSWDEWTDSRRRLHLPVLLHRLCALKVQLLSEYGQRSAPLFSINGAQFDFIPFVQNILTLNLERGYLSLPPGNDPVFLSLKVCSDERKIRGNHNVGWFIGFPEAGNSSQSPAFVHTFALAHMRETALRTHMVWEEMQLEAGILELDNQPLEVRGHLFWLEAQYIADWKSLSYVMEFARANTPQLSDLICGWCFTDKGFLRRGWHQTDIFQQWEVQPHRHQGRQLPCLTSTRFRYCPMHGCNRLLDNTVRILQTLGKKKEVADCMQMVCPNWSRDVATQCKHMKLFFQRQLHVRMASFFTEVDDAYRVRQRDGSQDVKTTYEVARMLLDACHGFYKFAYTIQPSDDDFQALQLARDSLLAAYDAVEAELAPTTHYMTSHFLEFARKDGTAYHALQEAAEHHHKQDRKDSRVVFTSGGSKYITSEPLQQLLDFQEVRRILIRRGHPPV